MLFPLFFTIGSIMPDIDLPRDKWWRNLILNIMFPVGGYIIGKRATHWGRVHSIIFGMLLSAVLFIGLLIVGVTDSAVCLSAAFFLGFIYHLIIDQVYHELRLKHDYRFAFKLWSNTFKYDPFIWIWRKI